MMKSVRSQLLILILAVFLPALGIIVYSGYERQRHDVETTKANALTMAQVLGNDHENDMEATRRFLMTLARLPVLQNRDAAACNKLFRELLRDNQHYSTIAAADREGRMFASALPFGSINLRQKKYFQEAVRTKTFSAGEYSIGQISGRAILPFAYPVTDSGGRVTGVVAVTIDLEKYGRSFVKISQFPKGSTLNLLDRNYTRLYRYPDNEKFAGKTDLPEMIRQISKGPREGIFTTVGVDGVRRIFAYRQFFLEGGSSPYLYLRVGIPEEQALAPARKSFLRNLALVTVSLIAAVLTAWLLGHILIVRRLDRLVDAAMKVGQGDFSTRTRLDRVGGELGQLARSFDEMAQSLEKKELDRRQAEEKIKQSEEKLKEAHRIARLGDWELDLIHNTLRWSDGVYELFEINPAEFGASYEAFLYAVHPDDREKVNHAYTESVKTRTPYEITHRLRMTDGRIKWVNEICRTEYDPQGHPIKSFGIVQDITDLKQAQEEREKLIAELQQAMSDVKVLSGMLPICASCKKIRDDKGYWNRIEAYIGKHSNAQFSHGICPECARKLYPELYEKS
ncbi:MAG: PAS domain-containing protein [Smithella sp.]|nr:PAS domain-containing protein [Smithella sp.]